MIYRTYKYLRDKANNSKGGVCRSGYLKLSVDFWFSFFFLIIFSSPPNGQVQTSALAEQLSIQRRKQNPPQFSLSPPYPTNSFFKSTPLKNLRSNIQINLFLWIVWHKDLFPQCLQFLKTVSS